MVEGRPAHLSPSARRAFGAFYTPEMIARAICEAALDFYAGSPEGSLPVREAKLSSSKNKINMIDPACGAGVFLEEISKSAATRGIALHSTGLDRDPIALQNARDRLKLFAHPASPELACQDALSAAWPQPEYDLVLGNPPFLNVVRLDKAQRAQLKRDYRCYCNKSDLYAFFVEKGLGQLRAGGVLAMICSASFLGSASFAPLRAMLFDLSRHTPLALWELDPKSFQATVSPWVIFVQKKQGAPEALLQRGRLAACGSLTQLEGMPLALLAPRAARSLALPGTRRQLAASLEIQKTGLPLGDFVDFSLGVKTGADPLFVRERPPPQTQARQRLKDRRARAAPSDGEAAKNWLPCLSGREVSAYRIESRGRELDYRPARLREQKGGRPREASQILSPRKVLLRETSGKRVIAALDDKGRIPLDTLHLASPGAQSRLTSFALLALFNSAPLSFFYAQAHPGPHVKLGEMRALRVPAALGRMHKDGVVVEHKAKGGELTRRAEAAIQAALFIAKGDPRGRIPKALRDPQQLPMLLDLLGRFRQRLERELVRRDDPQASTRDGGGTEALASHRDCATWLIDRLVAQGYGLSDWPLEER